MKDGLVDDDCYADYNDCWYQRIIIELLLPLMHDVGPHTEAALSPPFTRSITSKWKDFISFPLECLTMLCFSHAYTHAHVPKKTIFSNILFVCCSQFIFANEIQMLSVCVLFVSASCVHQVFPLLLNNFWESLAQSTH